MSQMSPENANIWQIDDDEVGLFIDGNQLKKAGHTIVGASSSRQDATNIIPHLLEKGVDTVIMDGSLSGQDNTVDGEDLSQMIIEKHGGEITIIGHAQSKDIKNAHFNYPKVKGITNLVKTVTEA